MSYSELRFPNSPLTHFCLLVGEALSGARHERAPAARTPNSAAADFAALAIGILAAVALFRLRIGVIPVILAAAASGVIAGLVR